MAGSRIASATLTFLGAAGVAKESENIYFPFIITSQGVECQLRNFPKPYGIGKVLY
jgi:hypothetical protein